MGNKCLPFLCFTKIFLIGPKGGRSRKGLESTALVDTKREDMSLYTMWTPCRLQHIRLYQTLLHLQYNVQSDVQLFKHRVVVTVPWSNVEVLYMPWMGGTIPPVFLLLVKDSNM